VTEARRPEQAVTVQRHTDGVAVLRINVPGRNVLSTTTLMQLRAAAEDLTDEPPGAVVLRLVGVSRAKEMIFSGELLTAEEARRIGLVNKVAPSARVLDTAMRWAATLAAGPAGVRGKVKAVIDAGIEQDLESGLLLERRRFADMFHDDVALLH
jgi:enoyl-CoA hydratase/carnithine racemase